LENKISLNQNQKERFIWRSKLTFLPVIQELGWGDSLSGREVDMRKIRGQDIKE